MWTRKNPVFERNFIGYSTRKKKKKKNYKVENQHPCKNILTSCVVVFKGKQTNSRFLAFRFLRNRISTACIWPVILKICLICFILTWVWWWCRYLNSMITVSLLKLTCKKNISSSSNGKKFSSIFFLKTSVDVDILCWFERSFFHKWQPRCTTSTLEQLLLLNSSG